MIAACLSAFVGQTALANLSLGVEPYLGYSEFTYRENSLLDRKFGTILGGKGGVYIDQGTWLALDYHLGGPYYLDTNDNEYLNKMWGAGVGLRSQKGGRFWLGYYFDAKIDDIERNVLFKGSAVKISGGIEFQSKISFNLEYCVQNYKEVQSPDYTFPSELQVSVLFLSVSSPILFK